MRYLAEVALGTIVAMCIGFVLKRTNDRRISLALEDEKWKRESTSLQESNRK